VAKHHSEREQVKTIYAAFVKAQAGFAPALKTSANPHFKSKYADLAACVEAVIDALHAHGIALMHETFEDQRGVTVETVFIHESGETLRSGKLHVPAAKQDPQGYGSALTYARRYSLMAACGIAPEDDDGNAASRKPATKKRGNGVVADVLANMPPLSDEDQAYYAELGDAIHEAFDAAGAEEAFNIMHGEHLDNDQKIYLSAVLRSDVRAGLKKEGERRRKWHG
jgi:hypothetical protein